MSTDSEPFDYFYSRLVAQVYVTETRGGRYEVRIDDPFGSRQYPFAVKVFKRSENPSTWLARQFARIMPKLVAELHRTHNDDRKPEPLHRTHPHDFYFDEDDPYSYGDWRWA